MENGRDEIIMTPCIYTKKPQLVWQILHFYKIYIVVPFVGATPFCLD